MKQEREAAELEKKQLEERLAKFEEDARKAQEGVCGVQSIEIINNTRAGIVIFFRSKKGNALLGANSSPGYFDIGSRTKDLRSFHCVFIL